MGPQQAGCRQVAGRSQAGRREAAHLCVCRAQEGAGGAPAAQAPAVPSQACSSGKEHAVRSAETVVSWLQNRLLRGTWCDMKMALHLGTRLPPRGP